MANISAIKLPDGVTYNIKDDVSGYITGMTILSYGSSTWQNFIDAYNANKVVYCRASSNSNPASGSQTRLAFMAYINNATTPTEVEFQYYRSVSSHTDTQQGDQVYVYKLNSSSTWSVTTRETYTKMVVNNGITSSYTTGTSASMTISLANAYGDTKNPYDTKTANYVLAGPTSGSAAAPSFRALVAADIPDLSSIYLTSYTETDPTVPSWAKESSKPSYTASEVGAIATSEKGAANGVAPLDANSLISSTYLPSYVDDVLEYATKAGFPAMGETGKIYVDTDTNKTYRWGGSEYVEISASLAIGKTSSTAAAGNHTHSVSITPTKTDVYSMTSAGSVTNGTKASFTPGSFSGGSLTMTINGSDSGRLDIVFTAATHGADSFTQNTPTAVTLPGRSTKIEAWTGYSSATAQAQT